MKVKMLVGITGTYSESDGEGGSVHRDYPPLGAEVDLPDAMAADLCAAGYAEPVGTKAADKREKRSAKAAKDEDG